MSRHMMGKFYSTILVFLALLLMVAMSIHNSPVHQTIAQSTTQKNEQSFANSFENIINEARLLTHDYQVQEGKWRRGEHNNGTMASITDTYLPKYEELVKKTKDLQAPTKYENITKLYAKSIESELKSHIHFRNYLLTGNTTENEASIQSLSDAFRYETDSFRAFKSVSETNNR
jgi:hypothetical protein